jgi:outer membrane protein TolC
MHRTKHFSTLVGACALLSSSTAWAEGGGTSLEDVVRSTFEASPVFRTYEVQTREANASRTIASGAFDVVATAGIQERRTLWPGQYGALTDDGYADLSGQVGLATQLRENVSVQLGGNYPIQSTMNPALSPDQPQATGSITIPLLKLGRAAAASGAERAAMLHASAAAALQQDQESALTELAAESYWLWVGSFEQVKVTRRLEEIARDQLRDVDALIEQHARPASDRHAFAAVADTTAAVRGQAEQTMFTQQQALWELLGLPAPRSGTAPSATLPDVPQAPDASAVAGRAHRDAQSRALLRGLRDENAAARAREDAAAIAKRPDVNLIAQGAAARIENHLLNTETQVGYYGGVALQFSLPIPNRAARGAYELAAQARIEQELAAAQRRNAVDARIDALADALLTLARTYRQRVEASTHYQAQFEAERVKFRLGNATAIEVVLAEQQYTTSSLAVVADRASYAVALARLLHESGALQRAVQLRDAVAVVRALTSNPF